MLTGIQSTMESNQHSITHHSTQNRQLPAQTAKTQQTMHCPSIPIYPYLAHSCCGPPYGNFGQEN